MGVWNYKIKNHKIDEIDAIRALIRMKAANVEIPKDFPFSTFLFCGCKKRSCELLVSPAELIDRYNNGDIGFTTTGYMAAALYMYLLKYLSLKVNTPESLGLMFEAGRLQGIREERRKHNKRKEGKTL